MTFGIALDVLLRGGRIRRAGWPEWLKGAPSFYEWEGGEGDGVSTVNMQFKFDLPKERLWAPTTLEDIITDDWEVS